MLSTALFNPQTYSCRFGLLSDRFIFKMLWTLFMLHVQGELSAQCYPTNTNCSNAVRLQSLSDFYTASLGDTIEIPLMLYFTADSEVDTAVELKLEMPESMPEIAVIAGSDFSEHGENITAVVGTTGVVPLTAYIRVDATASAGDIISIPVVVDVPSEFCNESDSASSTIHLYLVDAHNSTCLCENEEDNLSISGNVNLSVAIQKGLFGFPVTVPPCISINGTLTVDVANFQISNCEIILGPAARIFVRPNSSLTLRNNYIHGCDYLWHSIAKSGSGTLLAEDNRIEDGLFALQFVGPGFTSNLPVARISNNTFNKNFISVSKGSNIGAEINFQAFSGNEFTCEDETLLPSPNPSLSFPPASSKSFAGVYLVVQGNTANLSGLPSAVKNYFHHLQNGIIADGTNVIIKNARFSHIPVNNDYANNVFGIGYGIYNTGGIIQAGEGKFSAIPSFKSVNTGIYVGGAGILLPSGPTSININSNHMEEVKTGIEVGGVLQTPSLNIFSNSIYCDYFGIDLYNTGWFSNVNVTDNRIFVDNLTIDQLSAQKGIGIKISNPELLPLDGRIESNAIHLYEKNYGIYASLTYGGAIRQNIINMYDPTTIAGIRLDAAQSGDVSCNFVHGASTDYEPGKHIGIDVGNSLGMSYQCNKIDTTYTGFRFSGACSSSPFPVTETDIRGNTFRQHGYGFQMQPDALFGSMTNQNVQAHKGNSWSGDYSIDKSIHYGFPDNIFYSKFRIHTDDLPFYPYSDDSNNPNLPAPPTPNAPNFIWFEVMNDGSPYNCGQECPQPLTGPDPDSISSFGLAIVQDSLDFTSGFDESIKETLKRNLYRILDDYPALLNQNSALQQFYSNESASVTGTLTTIDRLKYAAISIDSASKAQLLFWEAAIQDNLDSISVAEDELSPEPDSVEIANFEDIRTTYLIEIDSLLELQRQLSCSDWSSKIALIDSALVLNSGIQAITDIVSNEKKVNQLYLEKVFFGNFDFTSDEENRLDSIANQCPNFRRKRGF